MTTELAQAVLRGERLALARLLTQVENDTPTGRAALDDLFAHTGRAHLVGVTGSPGTGKSSLVNQLARGFRHPPDGAAPRRVAVVAVDPSSPFTGGAVLGDRVRMRDLVGDPGVFVRSMASRGTLGGLARTTAAVVQVLDAAGYEMIFIETVGAGQSEVDIARLAHTTLVVEAPGLGDDIQAIKAGILEIADILVINKADRPGVENTQRALRTMLELAHPEPATGRSPFSAGSERDMAGLAHHHQAPVGQVPVGQAPCGPDGEPLKPCDDDEAEFWPVPVLLTIAPQSSGITELVQTVLRHGEFLQRTGGWHLRERNRLQTELNALLQGTLVARWRSTVSDEVYQAVLAGLVARQISPFQAVKELVTT